MALIQAHFLSKSLKRTVSIQVILPVDTWVYPGMKGRKPKPYKTLYLLHGLFGYNGDWISGTRIQRWAEAHYLAVVMPSGENGFYLNQPNSGDDYNTFMGEELLEITRLMFPLSHKREDTFIAGLSMGGYGAVQIGLKYAHNFSHIAGLSSAFVLEAVQHGLFKQAMANEREAFGDIEAAKNTEKDLQFLAKTLKKNLKKDPFLSFPKLYIACGTEDGLLEPNRDYHQFLLKEKIDHVYVETAGGHDWDYWDKTIQAVLAWLPLEA